jgi:hypothetical protein
METFRSSRMGRRAALLLAVSSLQACSIVSPVPLWELAKATGTAATAALPYGPSHASNTVYHLHRTFRDVCIQYNPDANIGDVVPALQRELQKHAIDSRVYEGDMPRAACPVWLRYRTEIAWDVPPMSRDWRPYVSQAWLTLRAADGSVLSSSQYEMTSSFSMGKWASTQHKLAPVVTALLTGFQN